MPEFQNVLEVLNIQLFINTFITFYINTFDIPLGHIDGFINAIHEVLFMYSEQQHDVWLNISWILLV